MKECYYHCTKMQLLYFPFFLSSFDFFPESGIRKEEAMTSVHPFPEVPLFWCRLHPSALISFSDPLLLAPGSLASRHSSSVFRSSSYLFPGVLDSLAVTGVWRAKGCFQAFVSFFTHMPSLIPQIFYVNF